MKYNMKYVGAAILLLLLALSCPTTSIHAQCCPPCEPCEEPEPEWSYTSEEDWQAALEDAEALVIVEEMAVEAANLELVLFEAQEAWPIDETLRAVAEANLAYWLNQQVVNPSPEVDAQVAIAQSNVDIFNELESEHQALEDAFNAALFGWAEAVNYEQFLRQEYEEWKLTICE